MSFLPQSVSNSGTLAGVWDAIAKLQRSVLALQSGSAASSDVVFYNGWRNYASGTGPYGGVEALRAPDGMVFIEGIVDKSGGNFVVGETMFTLPDGCLPRKNLAFTVIANGPSGDAFGRVDVRSDGSVVLIVGASSPVGYVSLSGICYRAA